MLSIIFVGYNDIRRLWDFFGLKKGSWYNYECFVMINVNSPNFQQYFILSTMFGDRSWVFSLGDRLIDYADQFCEVCLHAWCSCLFSGEDSGGDPAPDDAHYTKPKPRRSVTMTNMSAKIFEADEKEKCHGNTVARWHETLKPWFELLSERRCDGIMLLAHWILTVTYLIALIPVFVTHFFVGYIIYFWITLSFVFMVLLAFIIFVFFSTLYEVLLLNKLHILQLHTADAKVEALQNNRVQMWLRESDMEINTAALVRLVDILMTLTTIMVMLSLIIFTEMMTSVWAGNNYFASASYVMWDRTWKGYAGHVLEPGFRSLLFGFHMYDNLINFIAFIT